LSFFLVATSPSVAVITAPLPPGRQARRDRARNTVRSTVPVRDLLRDRRVELRVSEFRT
jgi:hypothetical protein